MKQNSIWQTNVKAFKLVHSWRRRYFPSMVAHTLFKHLTPFLTLYMSALIVSELAGARDTRRLLGLVIFTVVADLVITLSASVLKKINTNERRHLENAEKRLFTEYGFNLDYEHLENPEITKRRRKIDESAKISSLGIWRFVYSVCDITDDFIRIVLALAFMGELFALIARHRGEMIGVLWFPIAIVVTIALGVFFSLRNAKTISELGGDFSNNMMEINRISNAFPTDYQAGKEVRLYNMSGIYEENEKQVIATQKKGNKIFFTGFRKTKYPNEILRQVMNFSAYAFVALNAVRGLIDIGGVIKYIGFITQLATAITELCRNVVAMRVTQPFLVHYLEFFEIENNMYKGTLPVEKRRDNRYEIEFKNVSFKYPGTETYALRHFSMKLRVGQRLAVVGMNGSGKTTMIKLLCRLYDPTEGEITLNGFDIKKYNYAEYLGIFSVVFQDFKLFGFSLAQNIAASMDFEADKVTRCMESAGLGERLRALPNGIDTPLYKNFDQDGVEISGGEAQKVALARALYKNAPFIVLDEPTSALDPIAEYEIYTKFNDIVEEKTAVYISHRLSSCRFCDDIAVFHEGRLLQRGTHDDLLADEKGKYNELWNAQAQYYAENV